MKNLNRLYKGKRVTIMGLGLHGGGLASALFFLKQGAEVTVTDLKTDKELADSLIKFKDYKVNFVLGRHEEKNFVETDLIIKNPGVKFNNPFLAKAQEHKIPIETDISIFLRLSSNPLIAVTGSKGKSTTSSAIHQALLSRYPHARLGGNITVSPLTFVEDLNPADPVVLELSSWQLADLKDKHLLKPMVSLITCILPDHLNHYNSMADYVADKKIIYREQTENDYAIFFYDDLITQEFIREAKAQKLLFSKKPLPEELEGGWLMNGKAYLKLGGKIEELFSEEPKLSGEHNLLNLLAAALSARAFGLQVNDFAKRLLAFKGIEHRFEVFFEKDRVRYINDSAATIPHATLQALKSITERLILICGGTDKNLDFSIWKDWIKKPEHIILLEGSATTKIIELLKSVNKDFAGPFNSLKQAVLTAIKNASPQTTILFSPGCASFGMFANEFERGWQFKEIVLDLQKGGEAS